MLALARPTFQLSSVSEIKTTENGELLHTRYWTRFWFFLLHLLSIYNLWCVSSKQSFIDHRNQSVMITHERMNVSNCLYSPWPGHDNSVREWMYLTVCTLCGPGHDSSVGRWMYLTVCPLRGPGHDSLVGRWMYLNVCPLRGPGHDNISQRMNVFHCLYSPWPGSLSQFTAFPALGFCVRLLRFTNFLTVLNLNCLNLLNRNTASLLIRA